MERVALLGLGVMGAGMARNILKAGFPLTVYNRTREKAQKLAAGGAQVADTPRAAAQSADVVISIVGDDAASRAIWLGDDGALAGAQPDSVLVECSTLSLAWVRELADLAVARGLKLIDAPMLGGKDAAEAAQLKVLVGGDPTALERAQPVLAAISQQIAYMGPSGSGATMKLVNNMMVAVQAVSLAEGLILAERAGLNMEQVIALIANGAPGSPVVQGLIPRMVADERETRFALRWMHKDVSYALRAADELAVSAPAAAIAQEVFRLARNLGLDDADYSAVIAALRPNPH